MSESRLKKAKRLKDKLQGDFSRTPGRTNKHNKTTEQIINDIMEWPEKDVFGLMDYVNNLFNTENNVKVLGKYSEGFIVVWEILTKDIKFQEDLAKAVSQSRAFKPVFVRWENFGYYKFMFDPAKYGYMSVNTAQKLFGITRQHVYHSKKLHKIVVCGRTLVRELRG